MLRPRNLSPCRIVSCSAREGDPLGVIDDGAVVIEAGRIAWVGKAADADPSIEKIDLGGRLITPGLVDCHTHAIFAGDRANEFGMRARGAGYLEIAKAGGGIASTVAATRGAAEGELERLMVARMEGARATGTTTMEVKSGYDLTVEGELRLLRVVKRVAERGEMAIVPTVLCHVVPAERRGDRDAYVRELVEQLVPAVAREGLATSVDVYCDEGAFTREETERIWSAARDAGLGVRGHVGQFQDLGAAVMGAAMGARSIDHVEQIDAAGIEAIAKSGTVAVMLPGACVQLRLPVPPVAALRAAGVPMAVASDLNPGSSFSSSLPLQMWLATTHFGMTVEEAWLGVTAHAARALGLRDRGTIEVGARADLVVWNADHPAAIPYQYGANLVERVIR